jgi:hypothetical protein
MARCPLCDRALHHGVLCPVWWHHYEVCRRPSCRAAAEDALDAIETARGHYDDLASRIERRNTGRPHGAVPVGVRGDTMARLDHDDDDEARGMIAAAKAQHRGDA